MKYIEIIVLINLIIHFLLISITNYIFKQKTSYILITISAIIDIVYVTLYLIIPYELENYKYLFIISISMIPFIKREIARMLLSCLIYMMLNYTLGGISEQIYNIQSNFLAVVISLAILLIGFILFSIYKRIRFKHNNLMYPIIIKYNNKIYNLEGYCDTGNFLMTTDNIPVVFINNKYKIGDFKKYLDVNTVSTTKKIRLYTVSEFSIKLNGRYIKKDVYLAYGNIAFSIMFGLEILGG